MSYLNKNSQQKPGKLQPVRDENSNYVHEEQLNKQNKISGQKGEEYELNQADSNEVKELKSRMKIIMNKFNNCKKEKDTVQKQNKQLQDEIITLQSNLRSMIVGFQTNTSSPFPMQSELAVQIAEFYKYDCLDIFFDLLCPELNMKGIVYFFQTSFCKLQDGITLYFTPLINTTKKIGCLESIEGPIMNVLRKSFQNNFKDIMKKCIYPELTDEITNEIQNNLKLGGQSEDSHQSIQTFLTKLGELLLKLYICDPPLTFDSKSIGQKFQFNNIKNDPFDGFIKPKEECIVILPSVEKQAVAECDQVSKAMVLSINYEIPN